MNTTIEMQVIDASYSIEGDLAVVELFGRTRDGESVTVRYEKFHPYFCIAKHDKILHLIKQDLKDEVLSVAPIKLIYENKEKEFYKVTVKSPPMVRKIRTRYQKRILFTSADIIYALRFYYDFDLGLCIKAVGEINDSYSKYTTDLVLIADTVEAVEPFTVPLTYMTFDIECSIKDETLLVLAASVKKEDRWIDRRIIGDEDYIIREFERFTKEMDPDIITGWNIDNYDIPQLFKRAEKHNIAPPNLARNENPLRQHSRFWRATGRVIADGWWHTKLIKRPKKETLNAVAKEILGKQKLEIEAKNIDHHWEVEREKVIEYCLVDAKLALEILIEVKAVDKGFNLGAIAKLPLEFALENKVSQYIDSLLIRVADEEGYAIPCTKKSDKTKKIEGAYVHKITPGIKKWVIALDFKAMYPSIIITNNLCFSTYDKQHGTIITPIGAKFLDPSIKKGLIPRIMKHLQVERDKVKKKMKDAKKKGDENMEEFYDGLQYAIKVLSNSFYGVMTGSFYRFTNQDIGASITAFGRKNTKDIIKSLEEQGIEVLYGDTDSVMLLSPVEGLETTVEYGKKLSERFTAGGYILEFEKVFESFFSHGAKKRYVGKIVWPEEKIFVRGYEMRRTDSFDLQSETLEKVFDLILADKAEDAMNHAREAISDLWKGNVELSKLVISKTCRAFEGYKYPERMPNVQAAQKLIAMGYQFTPGSKVSWIVTDASTTPLEVEPYLDGVPFHSAPDWEYYVRRLATTVGRATEAFGWAFKFLVQGREQSTLPDFKEDK